MAEYETSSDICNIIAKQFREKIIQLMKRSRGEMSETPIMVEKEIGAFIYKHRGEYKITNTVEGDSYSIGPEKWNKLEKSVPDGREELYPIHTHPSDV